MFRSSLFRVIGGLLVAGGAGLVIWACLFMQPATVRLPGSDFLALALSAEGERNESGTFDDPEVLRVTQLHIEYPQQMRENESLPVRFRFEVGYSDPDEGMRLKNAQQHVKWLSTSDAELEVQLVSTGFDVAPEESFHLKADQRVPAYFDWTITPKQEGSHNLRLSFQDRFLEGEDAGLIEEEIVLNGSPLKRTDGGSLFLPVVVTTYAGVSRLMLAGLGVVVSLVGFVLTWDIVLTFIKRKAGMAEDGKSDKSTIRQGE